MLWKWVSRHRLFNIGSSMCLGLNTTSLQQPLNMFKCDSTLKTLWWRCSGNTLFGAAQLKLTGKGRLVVATKQRVSSQRWKIYLTSGEGPCAHPYEEIHTVQGNSHGMPCVLPFKYNNKWYSECTTEGREDNYRWCATTSLYDQDEKWGFCPNPGLSPMSALASTHCGVFNSAVGNEWQNLDCGSGLPFICKKYPNFTRRAEPFDTWQYYPTVCSPGWFPHNKFCYKLQSQEQSWKDSLTACRSSNADLISVHSLADVALLFTLFQNVSETVSGAWIGLTNKTQGSFEWSDGSPVTFTYWHKYEPNVTYVEGPLCVRVTTDSTWQVKMCDERLPSVCKKPGNLEEQKSGLGDKGCSEGWKRRGHFCYKVTGHLQNYEVASKGYYCNSPLVTVGNRFEQAFINSLIQNITNGSSLYFWTALQDRNRTGEYSWLTQKGSFQHVRYTNWNKYQPASSGGCVAISGGKYLGRWEVKDCNTFRAMSICKQAISSYKETESSDITINQQASCAPGWESKPDLLYCYKVFHSEKVLMKRSWEDADFFCQALGSNLVSFSHYEEEIFLNGILQNMFDSSEERLFWAGFNKRNPLSGAAWEWSDGTAVVSSFIEDRNNEDDQRNCAAYKAGNMIIPLRCDVKLEWICKMPKGRWSEGKCNGHHPYICERKTVSVVEIPREPHLIGGCPERWLYFGHKCFLMHVPNNPQDLKNWNDAQAFCKSHEGSLVSVENEIEQAYLTMLLLGSQTSVWIGLQNDDRQKWVNGKPVTYANWSPIEPENSFSDGDDLNASNAQQDDPLCTLLSNNHNYHLTGKWYNEKCLDNGYGFICQKQQDPSKPPSHQSFFHPLPNTIEYGNRSYRIIHGNMTWYEALNKCLENETELVSITDEFHQAFLTVVVNRLDHAHWIGLYSQDQDGINYQWSDGSDAFFTHWDDADEVHLLGDCVYMDINGNWKSADCETPLQGAVCHVPPESKPISYKGECPKTWLKFQSSCYSFEPVIRRLDLEESREYCKLKANMSDVLTIKNEEEHRFVLEELQSFGPSHQTIWLGIIFDTDNDTLEWFDGSPIKYSNWFFKAPHMDPLTIDSCVSMRPSDGSWHLSHCEEKLGFICKIHGGSSFEWSDGAVFDYKPWEFENLNSNGNCVFIDTKGFWKLANCNTVLDGAVCYTKTTPRSNIADTKMSSGCPKSNGLSNWIQYKDHCYAFDISFYNYSVFTMEEAKAFCQTLDPSSHLLTIQDVDENAFVLNQVKKNPLITGRVWLGITLDSKDSWKYKITSCESDWLPYNGYCYMMGKEPDTQEMADKTCEGKGGVLISIHSLEDIELIITKLHNNKAQEPDVSNATLQFHGHTYKIIKQNLTWYDALVQCRAEKMELSSISEPYQQAFLTVTINRFRQPAWIGLFSEDTLMLKLSIRDEHENDFLKQQLKHFSSIAKWVWIDVYYDGNSSLKWYDGTYVQYSNWRGGRPEVNSSDFYTGIQSDGAWDLLLYTPFFKYFQDHSIVACKIERDFKDEYHQSLSEFIKHGNFSFRLIRKKMNWYDVVRECKSSGSDLASICDEAQQLFLKCLVKLDGYPLWIGLSNQDDTGSSFEWSDGAVFDYKPWEFENLNSNGNCVFIDTKGFWKLANCNTVLDGAVCYTKTTPRSNIADTKMSSGCPKSNGLSNRIQYKDHCYAFDIYFYNYSVFTMEEAKAFCQTLDPSSHLLTIQDVDENAFVLNQVKKNPLITGRVWLGITLDSKVPSADVVSINSEAENSFVTDYSHRIWNGTKDVWLGMSFNVDTDSLKWFDGLDVVYTNWMHDAYSEDTPVNMCAILHTGSGKWENVSCEEVSEKAVVCETPMSKFHFLISFAKLLHLMLWKFQKHSKNYTYITIRAVFLP
ncbi:UNVERIFIED_CONTAM: hypothetical protein FKN15_037755 [Acipenser sinensis]